MPLDLIAVLIVGAAAALFTWLFFRTRRQPMPRKLLPLVVGAAMLAYGIWSEYSWSSRTAAALPAGVVVIDEIAESHLWKPWTYLFPEVSRMIAIDRNGMRRNERFPGLVMVDVVLLERWLAARQVVQIIDCPNARIADATATAELTEGALPPAGDWAELRRSSSLYRAVCGGARP